jgi:hypothetical protein
MKKIILFLLLAGTFINHSQAKIQAGIGVKVGGNFGRWNNTIGDRLKLVTVGGTLFMSQASMLVFKEESGLINLLV